MAYLEDAIPQDDENTAEQNDERSDTNEGFEDLEPQKDVKGGRLL